MRFLPKPLKTLLAVICFFQAAAEAQANDLEAVKLVRAFENLELPLPVSVVVPPDGSGRQFLILQGGKIVILPENDASAKPEVFLDISDRQLIEKAFEEGLLGLAFHPRFAENGKFYIYYTMQDPKQSVVSEMRVSGADSNRADPDSERVLLEVAQPFWNHNSGNLLFGPDGYLYICFGDGGKRDDPLNLAQNLFVLNGKVLRIDVDTRAGHREYGIPDDNPFVGMEGTRPEIFAYGFRNPWGVHFDTENDLFWCADVGQDLWEEIDLVVKGGNYGWSYREGARKFAQKNLSAPPDAEFIEPIHEYSHADGLSITGGFVYRGSRVPRLTGYYIYGDFISGRIWALRYDPAAEAVVENHLIFERPEGEDKKAYKFTAFCEDPEGEILVLTHAGKVYRVE